VVLMAYDQHWGTGDAGPPAGQDWFEGDVAEKRLAELDPAKTIVALGDYGYDWTLKDAKGPAAAEVVTFNEATQTAHDSGATPHMDESSLNPTFGYEDDNGVAIRCGSWTRPPSSTRSRSPTTSGRWATRCGAWAARTSWSGGCCATTTATPGRRPGEPAPRPGRELRRDRRGAARGGHPPTPATVRCRSIPDTGLIAAEAYDSLPTSYVIQRYGAHPGEVALTFDDGPDGRWTPKILDILKAKHAPATFFVIGKNMAPSPAWWPARCARAMTSAATPGPIRTSARSRPPRPPSS
jgi:hypothetical protein